MSPTSSSPRVALVTGGSRGIGAEIAQRLARDGFHVVINFANREDKAREVETLIREAGGSASILGFDVSQAPAVEAAFESVQKEFGNVEVLVNNAGITIDSLLMRVKETDIDRTLDIDLKGAILCTKEASRQMMKLRKGSIISISSIIGEMGNAGQSVYAAAKSGLIGFSKSVAKELASRQIRVNVITPGFIQTEMTDALTDAQKEFILRGIPLGSFGTVQDVSELIAFLASDRSRYITGQVIGINGGMYM